MPKRLAYLYEQVITLENCKQAVLEGTKNLTKTPEVQKYRHNPEYWGKIIKKTIEDG